MTHRCSDCEGCGQQIREIYFTQADLLHTVPVGDLGDGYGPGLPFYPGEDNTGELAIPISTLEEEQRIMLITGQRSSICKACGARIMWIKTPAGRSMPCDPTPRYYTTHAPKNELSQRLVLNNGVVIACKLVDGPEGAEGVGFNPHWDTCPHVEQFGHKE